MTYAEQASIEKGLKFKTYSGVVVETTGTTQKVESHNIYVHEVVIAEGDGKGQKFVYNLDVAQRLGG